MSPKAKSKPRVSLSREIILDAAFRIVDSGVDDVTMSKLGAELGADPSAVYRHFRNKDELLLAMADVMLEESIAAYVEGDAPLENLRRMVWSLRRSYLRRPGLARYVTYRFTGGEAEAASVRTMIKNVGELGYDETESIARVRALAEMTLGHISMTADVLFLPRKAQAFELSMATSYYTYEQRRAPKRTDEELRAAQLADGETVYSTMLETFLSGLLADAPTKR
ncbi:MAG: helix-turn-helix domain-containing protein [Candidatus Nanopelagicales bacterium]